MNIEKTIQNLLLMGHSDIESALNVAQITSQTETILKMLTGRNIFLSGSAGTGKTEVIKTYLEILKLLYGDKIKVAVTATTGIAASLINGKTLHSQLGIPVTDEEFVPSPDSFRFKGQTISYICSLDVLIIDEVSMLSADLFIKIDKMLRYARRNDKVFGGIQVILSGDFLQLPPVIRDKPKSDKIFAFETEIWEELNLDYCYLDKSFRSKCKDLTTVLDGILNNDLQQVIPLLETRFTLTKPKNVATLFTKNLDVDRFNKQQQELNPNPLFTFDMIVSKGSKENITELVQNNRIEEELKVKVGDIVMVTKNVKNYDLVNGLIGVIQSIEHDLITIQTHKKELFEVPQVEFVKEKREWVEHEDGEFKLKTKIEAKISQYPLKLAYAITVHKSQGQTFDGVCCDLKNCFTDGLGYVALSRAVNLDGIYVTGISSEAYRINDLCKNFMNTVKFKKTEFDSKGMYEQLLPTLTKRGIPFVWENTLFKRPNELLLNKESKIVLPKSFEKVTEDVLNFFKKESLEEIEDLEQFVAILKRVYDLGGEKQ